MTGEEAERLTYDAFFTAARRARVRTLLEKPGGRATVRGQLAHTPHWNPAYVSAIPRKQQTNAGIAALLRAAGAGDTCVYVSDGHDDATWMALDDALDRAHGEDGPLLVIAIPGRLCYFRDEGLHQGYLLRR